jgi:(methylthio)acryloyl-CoA hydratase
LRSTTTSVHALPRIAEANPREGFMMGALMAAVAQGSDEAKERLRAFLEKRAKKSDGILK